MIKRFAILDESGVVINVVISDNPLADSWVESDLASIGDTFDGENWTFVHETPADTAPLDNDNRVVCTVENINIKLADQPAQPFNGIYFCNPNDPISITAELHQDGVIRSDLSIPFAIKMPLGRHANGKPTDDEIYLNVTLTNGVMSTSGTIPRSGDWKILTSRNNEALKVIGADWKLNTPDVTFIA